MSTGTERRRWAGPPIGHPTIINATYWTARWWVVRDKGFSWRRMIVEPVRSGQEFAAVMMDTTRMACGVELHIDWTEVSRRRATPVGKFDDADLCSRCVMAVGDQAEQIFDRDTAWR